MLAMAYDAILQAIHRARPALLDWVVVNLTMRASASGHDEREYNNNQSV